MAENPEINGTSENQTTGFISLYRSIRKHWIWADAQKLQWWIDMLLEANHKDQKVLIGGKLIECKRGQSINSLLTWAKRWRSNASAVRRFLKLLESDQMIVLENVSKTTRITICKYDCYQNVRNDNETITKRKRNDRETDMKTNNNDNNDNKGGATPPQKSFKVINEEEFKADVAKYKNKYESDLLREFFKYWTEKSASGKMKFQLEDTWETSKRLDTWQRRNERFSKNGSAQKEQPNFNPALRNNITNL